PQEAFEDPRKATELAALARAFDATLEKIGAADAADVLDRAARACAKSGPHIPTSAHVLRPAGLELAPLEETFLASCAFVTVPLGEDALEARPSAALTFSHALSEENEIRGVFRQILDEGLRLDDVEIAFDDDATYRPLVHELASQYGLPCTFDDGVPVTYTRPGQGILDYLDWIAHDFQVAALERLLADGRAELKAFQPAATRVGGVRAARLLRRARIFAGASRYAPRLDALVQRERQPEPEDESGAARDAGRAERLAVAETLRPFVKRLFDLSPRISKARVSLPALAAACREVVREMLTRASDLDGAAAEALSGLFQQLAELPERALSCAEAADRLREAVMGLAVVSATSAPGSVHVARLSRAGYAARPRTFVLGLDEARFPGPPRQDPVLLDSERDALNRTLPTASRLGLPGSSSADERRRALRALLTRARGKVVLSFSNRDILQDAERFPSPVLLQLYREREGTPDAGYDSLATTFGVTAAFVPEGAPLDETEWWLARIRSAAGAPGLGAEVQRAYPWLADGARAESERESEAFTPWDGRVSSAAADLDPRRTKQPLSASRLEKLAKCPRMYFYEYVLGLSPPEEERSESEWLSPREFGNLLHEVLYDFMSGLRAEGLRLDPSRDVARLKAVAGKRIARWRELVPPPNLAALRAQEGELFAACDIFLRSEAENPGSTPRWFEVPFGLKRASREEPLGSPDPIEIRTPGGSFLLQGQIDRIDETAPGRFTVWDYKSGGDYAFREGHRAEHPLNGGRLLQHALYKRAAAALLGRAGIPVQDVTSGYILPTRKGKKQRFTLEAGNAVVDETLDDLFSLVASGSFPHTADADDCRFCLFRSICGDVAGAAARAGRKRDTEPGDPLLDPMRAIRRRGV
ncbi:MAG TPA: PD-(D/E)XK nuclease family protein, partial [Thermoanaerobaculia bacterium]|nr:PD-(D/E)XK nuclease family protein [Thermoanaerobaculia bacterium]